MLQAVRVLAVAPIRGAARRLHIGRGPGLIRAKRPQRRGRVKRARPHFQVVGLHHSTPVRGPIRLKTQDNILK